ncbi:MAG: hypothetical protein IPN19_11235 [Elusimicrobia bacterium]|nr:hypothetical protein [Elusimicrobiota bacterium]
MSEIDSGGPAFPSEQGETSKGWNQTYESGMSMREWFAGMALKGYLSNPSTTEHPAFDRLSLSVECYAMADAMIRAGKVEK